EKSLIPAFWRGGLRKADGIANFALMILHLPFRVVHARKLPEHFDEVRLPFSEKTERHKESILQRGKSEVLLVQNLLRAHQFLVKTIERKSRRKHGVLHVEEPVIARREVARFGDPGFGSRVRRVHGD